MSELDASTIAIPPHAARGRETLSAINELSKERMADGRLLHLIKGLAGSTLDASEVMQQQLDGHSRCAHGRAASTNHQATSRV